MEVIFELFHIDEKELSTMQEKETTYLANIYLRLSKHDGDNEESYSISNQRELILDFLKSCPDIQINQIYIEMIFSSLIQ